MAARVNRSGWHPVAVGVALVSLLAAVSSGASAASPSASPESPDADAFTPQRASGIPGALLPSELKLWQYDSSVGQYVEVPGDASATYVPNLDRTAPEPYTIGYVEGWAANTASALIHKGIYDLAAKMGVEVVTCDAQFEPDKAVTCAETITQQQPDFVINANWRSEAATAMSKIFDAAKIPTNNADVMHPNAVFFGADNYISGVTAGAAAGDYAKTAGKCADVTLLLGGNPGEGEAANLRLSGFSDGVQRSAGPSPRSASRPCSSMPGHPIRR